MDLDLLTEEEPIPLTDALLRAREEVNPTTEEEAAPVVVTEGVAGGLTENGQGPQDLTGPSGEEAGKN